MLPWRAIAYCNCSHLALIRSRGVTAIRQLLLCLSQRARLLSRRGGRSGAFDNQSERIVMKILITSTPATGHLNPLLAIGRFLIAEGHEVVGLSGSAFRERIEGIGAEFRPLPAGA